MQANNSTPENDKKSSIQRSAAYPYYTIEESIDFVTKMKTAFQSIRFTREDAAKIVHKVDVSRDVASATQYGLLERLVGEGYKISQTAQHIIKSISEEEKADNLIECFKKPKLYHDLYEKYKGQALPPENNFHVILNRFHNITESAVPQAAKVFTQNATFVGLLNKQRVLLDSKSRLSDEPLETDSPEEERQSGNTVPSVQDTGDVSKATTPSAGNSNDKQPSEQMNGKLQMEIRLSEKKVARLIYPDNITVRDIEILKKQIEVLELTIDTQ